MTAQTSTKTAGELSESDIKIRMVCFGAVADIVGRRSLENYFPAGTRAEGIVQYLISNSPALSDYKLFLALNHVHTENHAKLSDGDEIAIFTAVSGG